MRMLAAMSTTRRVGCQNVPDAICIYVNRERERERESGKRERARAREREREREMNSDTLRIYMYIFTHMVVFFVFQTSTPFNMYGVASCSRID